MFIKILICSALAGLISLFIADFQNCVNVVNAFFQPSVNKGIRLFTKEELKRYNGIEEPELYLAILGKVYNVTRGENHYGPNKSYHIFVGNL